MSSTRLTKLAWTSLILYYVHSSHFTLASISGRSMSPTLNPESSLLEEDIVLIQRNPFIKRQDIVILKHPNNSSQLLCKRVKGLHGDRITPRTKTRWLGLYDRDDSDGIVGNVDGDVIVGEGEGWMEGDEPYVGMDSNQLGSLPLGLITAKVIAIVYPIHRIRFI